MVLVLKQDPVIRYKWARHVMLMCLHITHLAKLYLLSHAYFLIFFKCLSEESCPSSQ